MNGVNLRRANDSGYLSVPACSLRPMNSNDLSGCLVGGDYSGGNIGGRCDPLPARGVDEPTRHALCPRVGSVTHIDKLSRIIEAQKPLAVAQRAVQQPGVFR